MSKNEKKFSAVLFDMDGVIVDSMPYHFFAWYEAFRKYGIIVSSQDIYEHEGEKWETTLSSFLQQNNLPADYKLMLKIFNYRQKVFRKIFKRHLFPGVPELAAELKAKGYLLGVVSGTPSYDIKKLIPHKLLKLFDSIVGGDNIEHGKPHPDPYLKSAADLRLKPEQCLVIENAPLGINSAKSAGCFCLAVTTSLPAQYLQKADKICELKRLRETLLPML